jgi:hypothetical protein
MRERGWEYSQKKYFDCGPACHKVGTEVYIMLTFRVSKREEAGIAKRISKIVNVILQSCVVWGSYRTRTIINESHSNINWDKSKEIAKQTANKAAHNKNT